jgi:hypothetical protein
VFRDPAGFLLILVLETLYHILTSLTVTPTLEVPKDPDWDKVRITFMVFPISNSLGHFLTIRAAGMKPVGGSQTITTESFSEQLQG